ncbi:MAG: S8 family serine peptidase [Burkholderiales bacterium]|nr:S8 family serine peptidase [Burkholderiales bacterium]
MPMIRPWMTFSPSSLRRIGRALVAGIICAISSPATGADFKPDEIVVKLRTTTALPAIQTQLSVVQTIQFGSRPIYRLKLPVGSDVNAAVAAVTGNADVLLAEPNYLADSPEARKNRAWTLGSASAYAAQWAPTAMRLKEAHLFTRGNGVRVAVLDTGIDTSHPALAGKLLPGYDFVDGDADPSEVGTPCPPGSTTGCNQGFGHGTHVAGLIALAAPNAKIVPYRVLDPDGVGNVWVLAEALQKAIDPDGNPATDDGAHVINLSLGTPLRMKVLTSIAKLFTCEPPDDADPLLNFSHSGYDDDKARCAAGIAPVIVAAAGNLGPGDSPAKEYPAAESVYGLLAVAASDSTKHLASFSNSGSWVGVAAPGDAITSAMPTAASANGYATWSGTSMAAPLVAGTAALLRAAQPELTPKDVTRKIARTATALTGTNIPQVDAAAVVETCSMDVDGDGQVLPTTDGLIIMRAMMGMKDAAVSSAASPTAARSTWDSLRNYLKNVCLMNLP